MALPGTADLEIYHGDSWSQTFRLLSEGAPLDLTGATLKSSAVSRYGSNQGQAVDLSATAGTNPGEIVLSLPANGIPVGEYSYDVQVTKGAVVTTWLRGTIVVIPDVTA